MTPEARILRSILKEIGCEPDFRVFRNNVGVAEYRGTRVIYGLAVGSSDLIGVLRMPSGIGRFVALEVKSPDGMLTEPQEHWQHAVREMGAFACVVRSAAEARAALERARKGERQ